MTGLQSPFYRHRGQTIKRRPFYQFCVQTLSCRFRVFLRPQTKFQSGLEGDFYTFELTRIARITQTEHNVSPIATVEGVAN